MNSEARVSANEAERRLAAVPRAPSIQLEIANAVVRANKELFGRGPTKARVIVERDVVICVMADCLTTAERTLVRHGRREAVESGRQAMDRVARPKLAGIVERLTGRHVAACAAAIDLDAGEQFATFRLDGPAVAERDDSSALL